MATTTVISSGSGIGKIYSGQPMASISDALFVFDLNRDSLEYLKTLCEETKWDTITIYQVQTWRNLTEFEAAARALIKYAIFKNQHLCERIKFITKDSQYTKIINMVWPEEKRAITKFRGREWPNENIVKEFTQTNGCGTVGISQEKMDPNDIVSWFWEYEYEEAITSEGPLEYDHEDPEGTIPIPIEDEVTEIPEALPPLDPDPETGETPPEFDNVTYYYKHEYTKFPLQENHAIPAGNLTSSFCIPQNTLTIDACHMTRVECHLKYEEPADGATE